MKPWLGALLGCIGTAWPASFMITRWVVGDHSSIGLPIFVGLCAIGYYLIYRIAKLERA